MMEKKQLIVMYDDGLFMMRENIIVFNVVQLKKVFFDYSLEDVLDENDNDQIEYNRVNLLFRVEDEEVLVIYISICVCLVVQLGLKYL